MSLNFLCHVIALACILCNVLAVHLFFMGDGWPYFINYFYISCMLY